MKLNKRFLLGGFVVAALLVAIGTNGPQSAQAQQDKQDKKGQGGKQGPPSFKDGKFKAAFNSAVTTAAKSTVRIKCNGEDTALGVVLTADGFILTKASDLKGKITVKIPTGEEMEATWVGHHDPHDLAVLKIKAVNLIPIVFTDSTVAPVGNFVASVGTSVEPVAVGVVSVAARTLPPAGKKGGAADNKKAAPFLGVVTADDPRGAKVTTIGGGGGKGGGGGGKGGKGGPGSPAAGKLKAGDIIIAIGNKVVNNKESFDLEGLKYKVGEDVVLRVIRGDEFVEMKVGPIPAPFTGNNQNLMGSKLSNRITGFPVILQHDSVVLPQDCGGPLVDLEGHVIGINIARAGRVESHTIPSETIRPLLQDLMSGKLPPKK